MNRRETFLVALPALVLAVGGVMLGWLSHDAVVGAGLIALATMVVILYQSLQTRLAADETRRAAQATKADADASVKMLDEVRKDRELNAQPVVILLRSIPNTGKGTAGVQVENVGRGPAIGLRVVQLVGGELLWSEPTTLAAGRTLPSDVEVLVREMGGIIRTGETNWLHLGGEDRRRGIASVDASFAEPEQPNDLIAYCKDQLGNGLRFRLRIGEPPLTWHPSTEPEQDWATALREPFDWRHANLRPTLPFERVAQ
jgi:hypothetical protein